MEITLEQHYDITYLVFFTLIIAWLVLGLIGRRIYERHQKIKSINQRRAYEHLTRYSFTNLENN